MFKEKEKKHPSYGLIAASRVSGGKGVFFGSDLHHQNYIEVRIGRASLSRQLHSDWYSREAGEGYDVILKMTMIQWAEFVSGLNMGEGVPCTLTYTKAEGQIEQVEELGSKTELFRNEFKKSMSEVDGETSAKFQELKDMIDNLKISNKAKEELNRSLRSIAGHMHNHVPFIADMFEEHIEKVLVDGKKEMEAFAGNLVMGLGMEKLQELSALAEQELIKRKQLQQKD